MPSRKWRSLQEEKKRQADLSFLAELKAAGPGELALLDSRYRGKDAPIWKRIALDRALARTGLLDDRRAEHVRRQLGLLKSRSAEPWKLALAWSALGRLGS